ncbi:hypothetical protein E4M00_15260 [Leifsonia flava]|uniref:Uncharacterized protein n=2 Tax=Orlajensenia leifsoniae TaxID=2561933 RepID=A0A4Y9QVA8_9MICO|nr:hypothetical protein E4M00_15260 [Leifsonia flava]
MRGLLGAAVAQNWCDFDGRLAKLKPSDPIDAAVRGRFGANTTYVLRPPDTFAQQGMFAALSQFVSSLEQRPTRANRIARPVGRLLRDFEVSLAAGQAATSLDLLEEIERTGGISHENIAFLRFRRLSQLGEDRQILDDHALRTLVATEPPRLVREAVLAAWYRVNARDGNDPIELIQQLRDFRVDIALLVDNLSAATVSADVWGTVALVALARGDISLARDLLGNDSVNGGELRKLVRSLAGGAQPLHPSDAEAAGATVERVSAEQTDDTTEPAVSDHSGETGDDTNPSSTPQRTAKGTEAGDRDWPMDSWTAWLKSLNSDDPAPPLDTDLAGMWPAPGESDAELSSAIDNLPDAATVRIFAGLAAFIDCDDYAKPAWRTAAVLIRRHLYSDSLTPSDLGAISALLAIFLRGGPDVGAYRELLGDLVDDDIRGRWAAVSTASAAMDIADLVVTSPTADRATQQGFVATALETLHAQRHRLTESLRVIGDLATSDSVLTWDWSVTQSGEADALVDSENYPSSILLYSLEEAVLARAKAAVERIYPGIQVVLSSTKVGSVGLREHARRAGLIVLATRRAAHAATGFIQTHAGDARIEYADGCGSASMLRAVEQGLRLTAE